MEVNWNAVRMAWDIGQTLVVVAFSAYVWWANRNRASESTIRAITRRIDGVDHQIAQMEQSIRSRPDHRDLERLREEMSQTNRLLAEISANQKASTSLVNRLHDYLLNERGKP